MGRPSVKALPAHHVNLATGRLFWRLGESQ